MKKTLTWLALQVGLNIAERIGLLRLLLPMGGGSGASTMAMAWHWAAAIAITFSVFRAELTRGRAVTWMLAQAGIYVFYRVAKAGVTPDLGWPAFLGYIGVATFVTWLVLGLAKRQAGRHLFRKRVSISEAGARDPYFRSASFSVEIDDAASTVRISGLSDRWYDTREKDIEDGPKGSGPVDRSLPLLGLRYSMSAETRTESVAHTASGVGTGTGYVNGQAISVTVPVNVTTGYSHSTRDTGEHTLDLSWSAPIHVAVGAATFRDHLGELHRRGQAYDRTDRMKYLSFYFYRLPNDVRKAFEESFWPQVASRLAELDKQAKDAALAAAWPDVERKFLEQEAQAKAAKDEREATKKSAEDAALAVARAEYKALIDGRGVNGDFNAWQYDDAGRILWLVMVDHSGAALIASGGDCWSGPLAGAKVQRAAMDGRPADSELCVEVRDPDYEAAHLKRRRFRVLGRRDARTLTEWADRIEILAAR